MAFVFVYISEAHACDEWPVGHGVQVNQPTSTQDRIAVAEQKLAELGVGDEFIRLVDFAEENNFHQAYACWPLRWYTLASSKSRMMTTIAQPRHSGYDMRELVSWIVTEATRP